MDFACFLVLFGQAARLNMVDVPQRVLMKKDRSATTRAMAIDSKPIDKLLAEHGHRPQDIAGANELLKQLTKALPERNAG